MEGSNQKALTRESIVGVKLPHGRTLEQQIRFTEIAIKYTERCVAEEIEPGWASKQLDRLDVELHQLKSEQSRIRLEAKKALEEEVRRQASYVDRLRVRMKDPYITNERRRQIGLKIKRLLKKGKKR